MLRRGVPLLTKHVSRLGSVLVTIVSVAAVVGVAIAIFLGYYVLLGAYYGLGARAGSLIQ